MYIWWGYQEYINAGPYAVIMWLMDLEGAKFRPNLRLKRIAEELLEACRENHADELQLKVLVDSFEDAEKISIDEDANTILFAEFLESEGIAACTLRGSIVNITGIDDTFFLRTQLEAVVRDKQKLIQLLSAFEREGLERFRVHFAESGHLHIGDHIVKFGKSTPAYEILSLIMKDAESRDAVWSYGDSGFDTLYDQVQHPDVSGSDVAEYYRQKGYYINKMVRAKIPEVKEFLLVTTESLRLNPIFV